MINSFVNTIFNFYYSLKEKIYFSKLWTFLFRTERILILWKLIIWIDPSGEGFYDGTLITKNRHIEYIHLKGFFFWIEFSEKI
jgi:hypothetical protein